MQPNTFQYAINPYGWDPRQSAYMQNPLQQGAQYPPNQPIQLHSYEQFDPSLDPFEQQQWLFQQQMQQQLERDLLSQNAHCAPPLYGVNATSVTARNPMPALTPLPAQMPLRAQNQLPAEDPLSVQSKVNQPKKQNKRSVKSASCLRCKKRKQSCSMETGKSSCERCLKAGSPCEWGTDARTNDSTVAILERATELVKEEFNNYLFLIRAQEARPFNSPGMERAMKSLEATNTATDFMDNIGRAMKLDAEPLTHVPSLPWITEAETLLAKSKGKKETQPKLEELRASHTKVREKSIGLFKILRQLLDQACVWQLVIMPGLSNVFWMEAPDPQLFVGRLPDEVEKSYFAAVSPAIQNLVKSPEEFEEIKGEVEKMMPQMSKNITNLFTHLIDHPNIISTTAPEHLKSKTADETTAISAADSGVIVPDYGVDALLAGFVDANEVPIQSYTQPNSSALSNLSIPLLFETDGSAYYSNTPQWPVAPPYQAPLPGIQPLLTLQASAMPHTSVPGQNIYGEISVQNKRLAPHTGHDDRTNNKRQRIDNGYDSGYGSVSL